MLFNTAQFVVFFALVLLVHRALPQQHRNAWLLGCSLLFYFLWIPAYLLLLLVDIAVNFALLRFRYGLRPRTRPGSGRRGTSHA